MEYVRKEGPGVVKESTPGVSSISPSANVELNKVVFSYGLPGDSEVRLAVYDATGSLLAQLLTGNQAAGNHRLSWDVSSLPSGVYFAKLYAAEQTVTAKLVIVQYG